MKKGQMGADKITLAEIVYGNSHVADISHESNLSHAIVLRPAYEYSGG